MNDRAMGFELGAFMMLTDVQRRVIGALGAAGRVVRIGVTNVR